MKILNLYAGIGGNRKLWGDEHEITAVEYNPEIATIYQEFFPKDKVIVADAHEYLLDHFREFDFIWSSPPCPTHSKVRFIGSSSSNEEHAKKWPAKYPDMRLYQEILFLKHYFKGKWVVENVVSYYQPLIKPMEFGLHYWWANFLIPRIETDSRSHNGTIEELQERKGFDLSKYKLKSDKRLLLRNCVEPEVGKHIFDFVLSPYKPAK